MASRQTIGSNGWLAVAAAAVGLLGAACSGEGDGETASPATGGSGAATTATTSGTGANGAGGNGAGASAGSGGSGALGGPFGHGVNMGYVPGFSDVDMATLARAAGANGARLSFPESHFATWGYDIEIVDNQAYQSLGVRENVAFLSSPAREHSSAPTATPDAELAYFMPANLYEPIFLADGAVNPQNYWADYVARTVETYRSYVKIYSVWNEPDWVDDWQVTQGWATEPPAADELPRFNGSIFDYVRMLRVTSEVAHRIDPEVRVAVGGLGYPTFFAAVLRYTDNPTDGSVTADYPRTGGAYVDVVDIHFYPIFSPGNSDEGVDRLVAHRDDFAAELVSAGEPPRPFIVTESGAPRVAVGAAPGGETYARNYLLKAMVVGQQEGIARIDWFALSDGASPEAISFSSMGLYEQLATAGSVEAAVRTPTGEAYRTLGALLEGARYDADAMASLELPSGIEGAVFRASDAADAKRVLVLWARSSAGTEDGVGAATIATDATWHGYRWDAAANGMSFEPHAPEGGSIDVALDSSPMLLVEQ
jgi:hypothetical protein